MTPDQARALQLARGGGAGAAGGNVKIAPEMRELLIDQAGENARAETAHEIDAHNARIERQEKNAEAARALAEKLKPAHEKPHGKKGK